VNSALVANGSVEDHYGFSPDGAWIAYLADQDTDETIELYAVATATPGTSNKLNGTLPAGGDLCNFKFDPASLRVAYCAEEITNNVIELFLVELAMPGVSTRLNSPLVAGGRVTNYEFSPGGDFIVYRADQNTDDAYELYRVDISAPAVSTKINAPLVAGGSVALPVIVGRPSFAISEDGLRVVYVADQELDQQFSLYSVELAAPGSASRLNPPVTGRGVDQFEFSEDGTAVVYQALQTSGTPRLFRADILAPGTSTALNGTIVPGGSVSDFATSPGLRLLP
jgi:Tol biopolymer transport system component